jgi:hypothetical protein
VYNRNVNLRDFILALARGMLLIEVGSPGYYSFENMTRHLLLQRELAFLDTAQSGTVML